MTPTEIKQRITTIKQELRAPERLTNDKIAKLVWELAMLEDGLEAHEASNVGYGPNGRPM